VQTNQVDHLDLEVRQVEVQTSSIRYLIESPLNQQRNSVRIQTLDISFPFLWNPVSKKGITHLEEICSSCSNPQSLSSLTDTISFNR